MALSDRPIARGEPDPLDFQTVASGLARFVANEQTRPPLTIAVTGEWGSGKSSLMNLTRGALDRYGFRSVWFNAWHHQTEEHMLGALQETLRRDAVPRWWRPDGFGVRLRLLGRRGSRHWIPGLAVLAILGAGVGYLVRNSAQLFSQGSPTSLRFDILAIVGALAPLVPILRSMRTFIVDTKGVIASGGASARLPTGFRHQFAQSFDDLIEALRPRRLIVFIDDLDRCQPAVVLSVFEMVNFLVSSGDCFIVLGMARERVERCIGLGFKDVAEELTDETAPAINDKEAAARLRRADFARNYLEKLINVEVPVPRGTPEQSRALMAPAAVAAPRRWPRAAAAAFEITQRYWIVLTAIVVLAVAFEFGNAFWQPTTTAPGSGPTPAAASTPPPPNGTLPDANAPTRNPAPPAAAPTADVPESPTLPGPLPARPWKSFTFVLFAIAAIGAWRLSVPPVYVERDSDDFKAALDIWYPLVVTKSTTPRAIKRFLNRVRFFAMRQRHDVRAPATIWERLRGDAIVAPPSTGSLQIPEGILVALTAVQHARPQWLAQQSFWDAPYVTAVGDEALSDETRRRIANMPTTAFTPYRDAFSILFAGVHVGG